MLKWEEYKGLTSEQKEEYNFRFREKRNISGKYIAAIYVIGLQMMLFVCMTGLVLLVPQLEEYQYLAADMLMAGGHFWMLGIFVVAAFYVYDTGVTIYKWAQFYKWRKRRSP